MLYEGPVTWRVTKEKAIGAQSKYLDEPHRRSSVQSLMILMFKEAEMVLEIPSFYSKSSLLELL